MKLGDAFTMGVPPNYDLPHLFFVISDPTLHDGSFVIVNITTNYIRAGKECVLQVGDHPWITTESYVTFRDARIITPALDASLMSIVGRGVRVERELSIPVLQRIVDIAKKSRSFAPRFKMYLHPPLA